jgi:DNA-binding winged helix-turn-helix (wHTH) protein
VRLVFGKCVFDPQSRQLWRAGRPVHVSPKAFELLGLLLAVRPRAVSRAETHDRLWPKTFVAETNLTGLVTELRTALGDDKREPLYIRTVHRYGYAFCGEASVVPETLVAEPTPFSCRLIWETREIVLSQGESLLGRTHDACVWIESSTVSRRHARIVVAGARAELEDLGSKNGTFLNGTRLQAPTPLADGDKIKVGVARMTFRCFTGPGSTETERTGR